MRSDIGDGGKGLVLIGDAGLLQVSGLGWWAAAPEFQHSGGCHRPAQHA